MSIGSGWELSGIKRCSYPVQRIEYDPRPQNGQWISVENRLPETEGRYLAFDGVAQYIFDLKFTGTGLGYWECGYLFKKTTNAVTHWMPLPEPPEVEPDDV